MTQTSSTIKASLYFTFREGCDVGSWVVVNLPAGEFDGEQAFDDMLRLTEEDHALPEGEYLQVAEHRFEVEREQGFKFRVIDVAGLERVAVAESGPARKSGYR